MTARCGRLTETATSPLALEMGYTEAEFARTLPVAMRDWSVVGGPHEWPVMDIDGVSITGITIRQLPARGRQAALRLHPDAGLASGSLL